MRTLPLTKIWESIADRGRDILVARRGARRSRGLVRLCRDLLSEPGEASAMALARELVRRYEAMDQGQRLAFFALLVVVKPHYDAKNEKPKVSPASAEVPAEKPQQAGFPGLTSLGPGGEVFDPTSVPTPPKPAAVNPSVSGRILTVNGGPIGRAVVHVLPASSGPMQPDPTQTLAVGQSDRDGSFDITLDEVPEKGGKSEPAPAKDEKKGITANQVAFIVKFDKDQDGKLSKEEFTGIHFPVYDKNGDGFIEVEEAPSGETAY